jgi:hypothetical protein
MKFYAIVFATTMCRASAFVPVSFTRGATSSSLNMVLEMPKETKKISKLEVLKVKSDHLIHPLREVRCRRVEETNCFHRFSSLDP